MGGERRSVAPAGEYVARARLLTAMLRRWDDKVVAITAGPGFGKSTLLAQAMHETPTMDALWPNGARKPRSVTVTSTVRPKRTV